MLVLELNYGLRHTKLPQRELEKEETSLMPKQQSSHWHGRSQGRPGGPTLSISLLAWRLRLLKNILLLSKCISSIVVSRVAALFPTMPLKAKNVHFRLKKKANNIHLMEQSLERSKSGGWRDALYVRLLLFQLKGLSLNL